MEIALYLLFSINNRVSRFRVRESRIEYALLLDEGIELMKHNRGLMASYLIGNLGPCTKDVLRGCAMSVVQSP